MALIAGAVADRPPIRYAAIQMAVDLNRISALLREHLSPRQEKVVRLYFGLGCSSAFSATEIAREFRGAGVICANRVPGIAPHAVVVAVGCHVRAVPEARRFAARGRPLYAHTVRVTGALAAPSATDRRPCASAPVKTM